MGDYYDDATFTVDELGDLRLELSRLYQRHWGELRNLLEEMIHLTDHSIRHNLSIEAIAD